MTQDVAVVAGASGVVGWRLSQALVDCGKFRVVGCARRLPVPEYQVAGVDYATLDLTDADACGQFANQVSGVTHLFYTARAEFISGERESTDINTAMFRNLLDAVEASNPSLRHVHMVHGTKYYGSTDGPFPTPAKEDEPRRARQNFYYAQEDIVMTRTTRRWSWSASRPHCICDSSLATPRSLPLLIATYAAICRHLGEPLNFPGTPGNYRAVYECTDARLLARAIVWMATEPRCADQAFNVTNGDFFRWENVWPGFRAMFWSRTGADKNYLYDRRNARPGAGLA